MMRQRNVCFQSFVRFTLIGWLVFLSHRLQNSRIFCEPERRRQYSNERSEEGVEKASKAGERRLIFFFFELTRVWDSGVWDSHPTHTSITHMTLRVFRLGKKKRLFYSLSPKSFHSFQTFMLLYFSSQGCFCIGLFSYNSPHELSLCREACVFPWSREVPLLEVSRFDHTGQFRG